MTHRRTFSLAASLALALVMMAPTPAGAAPRPIWQRSAGNAAQAVTIDGAGRIFVTGTIHTQGGLPGDLMVRRLTPNGQTMWTRSWRPGPHFSTAGVDVAADPAGNIYVIGRVGRTNLEGGDWFIRSYSSAGVLRWHREMPGWPKQGASSMNAIAVGPLMLVVAGNDFGCCGDMFEDGWVRAYDLSGAFLWKTNVEVPGVATAANDRVQAIAIGALGESYVGGYTEIRPVASGSNWFIDQDAVVQELSADGTPIWTWRGTDPTAKDHDAVTGLSLQGDRLMAVAAMNQRHRRPANTWVARFSFGGALLWARSGSGQPEGVSVAPSMATYVVGTQRDRSGGGRDLFLRKYSPAGASAWKLTLGDTKFVEGTGVATSGAAVVVSGDELDSRYGLQVTGWLWKFPA